MSNALMIIGTEEYALMEKQAKIVVESGLLPKTVNTWQKAVVIMMQGRELGIGAMASLRGIDVINGTPSVKPQLMLALIQRTGQLEDLVISDDGQTCSVTMTRKGRSAHTETFSMADAQRMKTKEDGQTIQLDQKFNWRSMPTIMRKWRAVAACARIVFPDVVMGLYTQDEMGEGVVYDETGEVIEGELAEPVPAPQPAPEVKPAVTENGQEPDSTPPADPADDIDAALGRTVPEDVHDAARETPPAAQNGETHWYDDDTQRKEFHISIKRSIVNWGYSTDDAKRVFKLEKFDTHPLLDAAKAAGQAENRGMAIMFVKTQLDAAVAAAQV